MKRRRGDTVAHNSIEHTYYRVVALWAFFFVVGVAVCGCVYVQFLRVLHVKRRGRRGRGLCTLTIPTDGCFINPDETGDKWHNGWMVEVCSAPHHTQTCANC